MVRAAGAIRCGGVDRALRWLFVKGDGVASAVSASELQPEASAAWPWFDALLCVVRLGVAAAGSRWTTFVAGMRAASRPRTSTRRSRPAWSGLPGLFARRRWEAGKAKCFRVGEKSDDILAPGQVWRRGSSLRSGAVNSGAVHGEYSWRHGRNEVPTRRDVQLLREGAP